MGGCGLNEHSIARNSPKSEREGSQLLGFVDRLLNGIFHYSSSDETHSLRDTLFEFSPAIVVLVATFVVSFSVGTAEGLFLVQSNLRTLVRFLAITIILLASLPILPPFIAFVGKRLTDEGFLGRLVKGEMRNSAHFRKSLLWIIRPLQGIGMSMLFSNQFLNLFRNFSEASFLDALIRPILFMVVSVPISILFSVIWSLDDLGIKLYQRQTGEVRLVGSYVGTILPVIFGAIGIYSLFQRSSPTDALLFLVLMVMVLYPPYVLFAVIHDKLLGQRKVRLFENLLFGNVKVQANESTAPRRLKR
jgi:hypothetical protein